MSNFVTIYQHGGFVGNRVSLPEGKFPKIPSPVGNDSMSSVRVPAGYCAYFYEHSGFRGRKLTLFQGDYRSLPGWNDKISSIEVCKFNQDLFPVVEFYQDSNYGGYRQALAATGKTTEHAFPFFKNDSISSMRVPQGVKVILYRDANNQGSSRSFEPGSYPNLGVYGWNDEASSVTIEAPKLRLTNIQYLREIKLKSGQPVAISSSTVNRSGQNQSSVVTLAKSISESSTRTWEQSTTMGLSVSVGTEVDVNVGLLSKSVEITLEATIEKTLTIGGEESRSTTVDFSKEVAISIPPHHIGTATIVFTPESYKVIARYTFEVEGTKQKVYEDAEIIVNNYSKTEAEITTKPIS